MSGPADQTVLTALGFAMKAGKVRSGNLAAEKALKSGKARMVLIDSSAAPNTVERWKGLCERNRVPLAVAENVGRAIGHEAHIVACVTDSGFADMIMRSQANPDLGGNSNGKN